MSKDVTSNKNRKNIIYVNNGITAPKTISDITGPYKL